MFAFQFFSIRIFLRTYKQLNLPFSNDLLFFLVNFEQNVNNSQNEMNLIHPHHKLKIDSFSFSILSSPPKTPLSPVGAKYTHIEFFKTHFSNARYRSILNLAELTRERNAIPENRERVDICKKNYKNSAKKLRRYSGCFAFFAVVVIPLIFFN